MKRMLRRLCRHPKKWTMRHLFQVFFLSILSILIFAAILAYLNYYSPSSRPDSKPYNNPPDFPVAAIRNFQQRQRLLNLNSSSSKTSLTQPMQLIPLNIAPKKYITKASLQTSSSRLEERRLAAELKGGWTKCSMYNCFDIHRCGINGRQTLSVYIYPVEHFVVDGRSVVDGGRISREYYEFLDALRRSPYYVPNPAEACVFVPSIDTLTLSRKMSKKDLAAAFSSLEFWDDTGQNHLLISMFPGNSSLLALNTEAIVAASGFTVESYRLGFHVPLISYNPFLRDYTSSSKRNDEPNSLINNYFKESNILAISAQGRLPHYLIKDDSILVLDFCSYKSINYLKRCKGGQSFDYPEVLKHVDFCLVINDLAGPALWDIMSVGCIPVIVADFRRLPFDEVLDWRKNAIILYEHQIPHLSSILQIVSQKRRERLKSQIKFTFNKYFRNMTAITNTLLAVLQDRVFSHSAQKIEDWNVNPKLRKPEQPLFNPVIAPKESGFTAVILAYERIPSLFEVIQRLAMVPSLAKIIVVWNNQLKLPPSHSTWPKLSKPFKVIQMDKNKMSNRFYPFDEIETEAVFSLDDDIIMLTTDEIEFGFETWREFPDRIIGFPSRSHVWDNSTNRWRYDSEWTNDISMVLTGAAFYHKYWHYSYTYEMSQDIREWVDSRMNCEDIAMNFLVAAKTGKAAIKVTPRKKFKCPTCSNNEMLSSDSSHMIERTDCINKFVQIYGYMPLVKAEFRADPVLYKLENLPPRLKKYSNVGSL